jgi:hypothetical protein
MEIIVSKLINFVFFDSNYLQELAQLYKKFSNHYKHWRVKAWVGATKLLIAIGRICQKKLTLGVKFFLRLLLTVIISLKSYKDLHTVNSTAYSTFYRVYIAFGRQKHDQQWIECFNEVVIFAHSHYLRYLSAMALVFKGSSYLMAIWEQFCNYLCNDITPWQLEQLNCLVILKNL